MPWCLRRMLAWRVSSAAMRSASRRRRRARRVMSSRFPTGLGTRVSNLEPFAQPAGQFVGRVGEGERKRLLFVSLQVGGDEKAGLAGDVAGHQ